MDERIENMLNIAIDGPAGAGKSTVARAAAKKLGYIYVDTGALYRAIGLFVLQRGVDIYDSEKIAAMLPMIDVELKYVGGEQKVFLCGENVTGVIRTPEVSRAASVVAAIAAVRQFLLDLQQEIAATHDVIMDGRDIGTVVLPDAQIKIFLTASPEKRARRRYLELCEKGSDVTYEAVLMDVKQRDEQDSTRAIAPLRPAEGAVIIDSSELTLEQTIDKVCKTILERLGL